MERLTVLKTALAKIPGMNFPNLPASSLAPEPSYSSCATSLNAAAGAAAATGTSGSSSAPAPLLLQPAAPTGAANAGGMSGSGTAAPGNSSGSVSMRAHKSSECAGGGAGGADTQPRAKRAVPRAPKATMTMEELVRKRHPDCTPNVDSALDKSLSARRAIYSYRTLFCRRCFRYDCYLHRMLLPASLVATCIAS